MATTELDEHRLEPGLTRDEEIAQLLMQWLVLYGDTLQPLKHLRQLIERTDKLYLFTMEDEGFMDIALETIGGYAVITEKGKQWLLNRTQ